MAVTGAGLEGIIAAESSICFIDGDAGILSYQGYDIRTLGDNGTFEEVIFLLWNGRLPKQSELDGLKAGDHIILSGTQFLQDGAPVLERIQTNAKPGDGKSAATR